MDMLNRLKSTVTTTVSQLSGVLPGNPVTREYEVGKQIGSAGPDLLWKIYAGHKKSTKQEAAVFVLEKKLLEKYSKKDRDCIVEVLKKGVAQLTRLRHPQILTVQHPLEESRESLAFATEPVFASLANILGLKDNLPVPPPSQLTDYRLFDVEIKYGLQQLCEGLIFLHNDVKLLHCNLSPESIIVNNQGAWKIFGFDFCSTTQSPGEDGRPGGSWPVREPDPELPPPAQPNLDYMAPELGSGKRYGGNVITVSCGSSTDMYSLGCLIVAIYQDGKSPWMMNGDVECYFRHAQAKPSLMKMDGVPAELVDHVRSLVQAAPIGRIDAHQLMKSQWFDDVGVKTLVYLDSLFQWDNLQKSQFYKGLPQILPRLPHRVCLYRVMPCLAKEFVNHSMVPFVLPCALFIANDATKENFINHILPYLKPVMKIQEPVQILLIFMQKMELLLQKTPPDDVKSDVLPMVYRALETETASPQIQELCLVRVPDFASLVDYPAMKNALLPRIKKLCINTNQLSVRVNCLLCIGKLLDNVDKWLVLDDVLPMLPQIPSKDPAVIMGILGIYKIALEHPRLGVPKETIATQILPFLFPLSVEPSLSLTQFRTLMQTVADMIRRVEEEQKNKLQNVQALQDEQRSSLQLTFASAVDAPGSAPAFADSLKSPPMATALAPATGPGSSAATGFANSIKSPQMGAPMTPFTASNSVSGFADSMKSPQMTSPVTPLTGTPSMSSSGFADPMKNSPAAVPVMQRTATTSIPASGSTSSFPDALRNPQMAPAAGPRPTWTSAPARPGMTDAVNSMIRSNLSAMSVMSPTAPSNPWPPAGFQSSLNWNAAVQPVATSLVPQFHQLSINAAGPVPLIPSPSVPAAASAVRPLARADIDDLLS